MSSFQGIRVPLVPPLQNGAIDFVGLRRRVGPLLEKGVDGWSWAWPATIWPS